MRVDEVRDVFGRPGLASSSPIRAVVRLEIEVDAYAALYRQVECALNGI